MDRPIDFMSDIGHQRCVPLTGQVRFGGHVTHVFIRINMAQSLVAFICVTLHRLYLKL